MLYVLQSVAWMAYQIAPALVTAAANFSIYGKYVFDFMKEGVDALNAIAKAAMPDEAKIDAFVQALLRVLQALGGAVGTSSSIRGALNSISNNLGLPELTLPTLEIPVSRPIITTSWPELPGRPPSYGGGGGGGGGGASGSVEINGFTVDALEQLKWLIEGGSETAADFLQRQAWKANMGVA